MKECRRKSVIPLIFMLLLSVILPGCQNAPTGSQQIDGTTISLNAETAEEPEIQEEIELWVMHDEPTMPDPAILSYAIKQFENKHSHVTIRLERVPSDEIARQQLRVQIMAGKGPDIYVIHGSSSLFTDVYQAMYNGLFTDISTYYDTDTALNKEFLHKTIMDAGIIDGMRFVLPLRYDFPVAYVDVEQFKAAGGNLDMFAGGIDNLLEHIISTGNPKLATAVSISEALGEFPIFNYLPAAFDYDSSNVLLSAEDVSSFLTKLQTVRSAEIRDKSFITSPVLLEGVGNSEPHYWTDDTCMYIGRTLGLLDNTVYSKIKGREIAMIPVTAADGALVASITNWGAVGYGCEHPEVAYELLRLLLLEQAQWNGNYYQQFAYFGLPVRSDGSIAALMQNKYIRMDHEAYAAIHGTTVPKVTNEDIAALNTPIDRVVYASWLENDFYRNVISQLNDAATGEALPADIDAIAAEFLDELRWHLAEG